MKELNKKQVTTLFDFVRSKYVRYIDVQHELVDHLASDIEVEMKSDSNLSFEDALRKVYGKFPITGFSNYISHSEKAITKFWSRKILSKFAIGFGIPFLFKFVLGAFLLYYSILFCGTFMLYFVFLVVIFSSFISRRHIYRSIKKISKNEEDKYLVLSIFSGFIIGFSGGSIYTAQLFFDNALYLEWNGLYIKILILSMFYTLSLVWSYMIYFQFSHLIVKVVNEKYAHLNLSV